MAKKEERKRYLFDMGIELADYMRAQVKEKAKIDFDINDPKVDANAVESEIDGTTVTLTVYAKFTQDEAEALRKAGYELMGDEDDENESVDIDKAVNKLLDK